MPELNWSRRGQQTDTLRPGGRGGASEGPGRAGCGEHGPGRGPEPRAPLSRVGGGSRGESAVQAEARLIAGGLSY